MLQIKLVDSLKILENYLSITIIPLLTIILIIKAIKHKRETGIWSYIRLLIIGAFISFCWLLIWEFLFDMTEIDALISREIFGQGSESFGIYNLGLLFIVTFGLTLVVYANGWNFLYFSPFLITFGLIAFYLVTGFGNWLLTYIYLAAFISLIFLYITAFRIKDNGSLGLAIMFSIAISTIIVPDFISPLIPEIGLYLNLAYHMFGLLLTTGYFRPFKTIGGASND